MNNNIRFWEFFHGKQVKITLKPGQAIQWHNFFYTDEGWEHEVVILSFHGGVVRKEWKNQGRDCDGMLTRGGVLVGEKTRAGENGLPIMDWDKEDHWQSDEYAEAMGY
ncbi:MAG: hypothetical protein ACXWYM_00010 [Candidatus Binatia bacterium]